MQTGEDIRPGNSEDKRQRVIRTIHQVPVVDIGSCRFSRAVSPSPSLHRAVICPIAIETLSSFEWQDKFTAANRVQVLSQQTYPKAVCER
jgi:hypothetical protein